MLTKVRQAKLREPADALLKSVEPIEEAARVSRAELERWLSLRTVYAQQPLSGPEEAAHLMYAAQERLYMSRCRQRAAGARNGAMARP